MALLLPPPLGGGNPRQVYRDPGGLRFGGSILLREKFQSGDGQWPVSEEPRLVLPLREGGQRGLTSNRRLKRPHRVILEWREFVLK